MAGKAVIVTFYDNFRQEMSSVGASTSSGEPPNYVDEINRVHNRVRVRVVADSGTYRLAVFSNAYSLGETVESRTTAPLAFNASAATIAAALNAISGTIGTPFVWTAVADTPNYHELDVEAAQLGGGSQRTPSGYQGQSIDLGGHLIWVWDEIRYEVDLEKGGCGQQIEGGKVSPEGTRAGIVPKRIKVHGGSVGDPDKHQSVLPGRGRRNPN